MNSVEQPTIKENPEESFSAEIATKGIVDIAPEDVAKIEGLFTEHQQEFAVVAGESLEQVAQRLHGVTYANDVLTTRTEGLSVEDGVSIKQRIAKLQERAQSIADFYMTKIAAFSRIAIFAAAPIIISGGHEQDKHIEIRPSFEHSTFAEVVAHAREQLKVAGVTAEQKEAYIPVVNPALHDGIDSLYYQNYLKKAKDFLPNVIRGRDKGREKMEDAYRMYLGISQEHDTFGISDHQPTRAKEQKYYYKISGFFENLLVKKYREDGQQMIRDILQKIDSKEAHNDNNMGDVMGHYTMGKGEDEHGAYISYYDQWDLDAISIEGKKGFFGKPYEIYDRIYYNPSTLEPEYNRDTATKIKGEWLKNYQ